MTDDHCDHCDLPKATCVHGNPPKVPTVIGLYRKGPTISATQYSECAGCGERIEPGEEITLSDEGWAHSAEVDEEPGASSVFEGII